MKHLKLSGKPGYKKISYSEILLFLAMLLIFLFMPIHTFSGVYDVTDFEAIGDGLTLNTKAIQSAIDACAEKSGGTVYFPAGTFLSGTIYLKDNISLYLEPGSILLGSTDVDDYPLNGTRYPSGSDRYVARALIWGEDLKNISISGRGTIDGQGARFAANLVPEDEWLDLVSVFKDTTRFRTEPHYINRPYLIRLISCRNVLVEKVTLQKPAMWLQHYLNCEFVTIRDVNIFSHGSPNNDLIDIDGCRNVVISGCYGDSDDDGITLKSTSAAPVQNVTISDCIIFSRTNAIKAGTESSGGFKDITITNCVLKPSPADSGFSGRSEGLAGIALEIVDGGSLDRVTISNITIEDMAAPIFLRLGNRARPYRTFQKKAPVGTFRNVKISHITATNAGRNGCSILGIKDHYIENVSVSDVTINFDGGGTTAQSEKDYPENDEDYPESTRYGDLPAYGFFCRHVAGLTFRDVSFDYDVQEARSPLIFDDVKNLKLFNFSAQVSKDAPAQLILKNTHDVFISECRPPAMDVFMRLEKNSDQIKLIGNDLSRVKRPFILDESVSLSALDIAGNLPADRTLFSLLEPAIGRDENGTITIRSFTADANIHYTLDGSEVTKQSRKYTQPFIQISECQIKARVFKDESVSACAVIDFPTLQVRQPGIDPDHSFFYESVGIDLHCATPGAEIRYSQDITIPVEKWAVYRIPFELKKSGPLYVQALREGYRPSEMVISRNEQVPRENGVLYKYYSGQWEKLPDLPELQAEKIGRIKQFRLEEIETPDINFALLMIGFVVVEKAGTYTFYCGSNDGSRLYIDNKLLIDNDGYHGFVEKAEQIYLSVGIHQIEVRYFQMGGSKNLKVSWQSADFDKTELSSEILIAFKLK
jgi:polygalacturonase